MRQILTTLILLTGLLSCKDKVGQSDLVQDKIEDQYKDLKETKEIKFEGGDVWGTIHIFNNADSSIINLWSVLSPITPSSVSLCNDLVICTL